MAAHHVDSAIRTELEDIVAEALFLIAVAAVGVTLTVAASGLLRAGALVGGAAVVFFAGAAVAYRAARRSTWSC
ncbi:hypothetical protein [Rhodococcoides corynebacterioides]|uniref:hypothetical protein n=1 Tax=Rhodococcoides corynebacterioides TaxID=53972 RepID=UPI000AC19CD6|nr:hypothetical protein [Rhodococcus corynebacterioides]